LGPFSLGIEGPILHDIVPDASLQLVTIVFELGYLPKDVHHNLLLLFPDPTICNQTRTLEVPNSIPQVWH
jgi:hypothetical protein